MQILRDHAQSQPQRPVRAKETVVVSLFCGTIMTARHVHLGQSMRLTKTLQTIAAAVGLVLAASWPTPSHAQSTQPDNTKVNQRDKNPDEATADQQKMNPSDRTLTASIRKSVMADKSLSTYGHNVKIISQNGIVTLKGPVRSEEEANSIMAKAAEAAGGRDKVVNQMSVKP
jgi:hyperosmotically inducible periplasmic protein